MRTSKFGGLPLMARKEPIVFFHVQWGVLALLVPSMQSLILLWVAATMEEEVSVCVWEELGIRADINL